MGSDITAKIGLWFEQPEYKFVSLTDVFEQATETQWLIDEYIPKPSVGMLYGPSGIGKSHIALHMAACIANGIPWCDRETEEGLVVVMAGEGHTGLNKRLKAIQKHYGIKLNHKNLFFSERALGVDTDDGFQELIGALEALDRKPSLIIIDTLSRHLMQSSENSNEEMANFINKLEQIKHVYDTSIMIVHHTGKNTQSGSRGASSIRANIDFSFAIKPVDFMGIKLAALHIEKQKDGDDKLPEIDFEVVTVELDEKGKKGYKLKGACAVRVGFATKSKAEEYEEIAWKTFDSEKPRWQQNFIEALPDKGLSQSSKKRKFREMVKILEEKGFVKKDPHSKLYLSCSP